MTEGMLAVEGSEMRKGAGMSARDVTVMPVGAAKRKRGEECGVAGAVLPGADACPVVLDTLHALQHRGQESAGLAWRAEAGLAVYKNMGLVAQVFAQAPSTMAAALAIGHTRYSTSGGSCVENAQPFVVHGPAGAIALAHNGHLMDTSTLGRLLQEQHVHPPAGTDSAILAAAIAHAPGNHWLDRLRWALERVTGSYGLVVLTDEGLFAARDPLGNRPLALGRLDGGWTVSSESCGFLTSGATFVRLIEPGEIVRIDESGVRTVAFVRARHDTTRTAFCAFEYVYLARPDSRFSSRTVYEVRHEIGRILAREHPVEADLVAPVPDSGTTAALGYAEQIGLPFGEALLKNRYVGRTFIQPGVESRGKSLALKFTALAPNVSGKRIVLVDDSLVRGTTMRALVALLRAAGASEVHLRIAAPPVRWPCFFGVDIPTTAELIAHDVDGDEVCRRLGADSLGYVSLAGLEAAAGGGRALGDLCVGCFTGSYPLTPRLTVASEPTLQEALR